VAKPHWSEIMSDWLTSHPHAKSVVEDTEETLELPEKFASFMRLAGLLDEVLGREPVAYELKPDDQRHAWSECFSASLDAVVNGTPQTRWEDVAKRICQSFESALQIPDATPWEDKMAKDRIYWETIARHTANLIDWCGDDSSTDVIESHMVAQMRDRI